MIELRAPVRCPHCNAQPSWQEVIDPGQTADTRGLLGIHPLIGWRCNHCHYFLAVSQWES